MTRLEEQVKKEFKRRLNEAQEVNPKDLKVFKKLILQQIFETDAVDSLDTYGQISDKDLYIVANKKTKSFDIYRQGNDVLASIKLKDLL